MNDKPKKKKATTLILASMTLLGFTALGSLFLGFEIGYNRIGPQNLSYKIDSQFKKVLNFFFPREAVEAGVVHNSALLKLSAESIRVPRDSEHAVGGGLTSFGDEILLVTQQGNIYSTKSSQKLTKTTISPPNNGFEDFVRISEAPEFSDYTFNLTRLRFNDIQFIESAGKRSLALSYTEFIADKLCYQNAIALLDIAPDVQQATDIQASANDWNVIYRSKPCLRFKEYYLAVEGHMAGGRIVFSPPSSIYLANGDFHWDGMRSSSKEDILAQSTDTHYGKVIEIDINDGSSHVVSTGHRNPQGIAVQGSTIFVAEHGPKGGDELNLIKPGKNYGWPLESLGTTYQGLPIPGSLSFARHENFEAPIYAWLPSVAISSLTIIDNFHENWDGDLLAGTLIDKSLHRLRMHDGKVLYSERIRVDKNIRYVHQHTDGRIILWTDQSRIVFLTPQKAGFEFDNINNIIAKRDLDERTKSQLNATILSCAECHSFAYGDDLKAPNLSSILGADIASTDYAHYSEALKSKPGIWDRASLTAFLKNPQTYASGSSMPNPNIKNDQLLEEVITVLEELERQF